MPPSFEHVVSKPLLFGRLEFTATPDLVAAEYALKIVTTTHIRSWLQKNDERATRAAGKIWQTLFVNAKAPPPIIRLTVADMAS